MYQLRTLDFVCIGQCVLIGGPYDRFGQVLSKKDTTKKGTLYLIRGIGNTSNRHKYIHAPTWAPTTGELT